MGKGLLRRVLWIGLVAVLISVFWAFFREVSVEWFRSPVFSYGVAVAPICAFLIWQRRSKLAALRREPWNAGLAVVVVGGVLQAMGSLSGVLLVSGMALVVVLMGITAFLWGKAHARNVALPLAFLIFMVPWPSYVVGNLSWRLQLLATTVSARALAFLGVPVYQDSNLLFLPNYALDVAEACSGTRSLFALTALAVTLGLLTEGRWRTRLLLIALGPTMAFVTNVIRIVGTGLAARWMGRTATEEALHTVWGILAFLLGIAVLLATQKVLRWLSCKFASAS